MHNYCNPLSPDYQNDEDWAKLMVTQGERYFIRGLANSLQTATVISLFAQDGTSLLAQSTPMEFGANTLLIWTSDRDGPVYLRFTHLDHRVIGTSVASTISVQIGTITYLPLINR
jgi:hypothetical protein